MRGGAHAGISVNRIYPVQRNHYLENRSSLPEDRKNVKPVGGPLLTPHIKMTYFSGDTLPLNPNPRGP